MARQRKLSPERKAFIDSLLDHYQPQDAQAYDYYKNRFEDFKLNCSDNVNEQVILAQSENEDYLTLLTTKVVGFLLSAKCIG